MLRDHITKITKLTEGPCELVVMLDVPTDKDQFRVQGPLGLTLQQPSPVSI